MEVAAEIPSRPHLLEPFLEVVDRGRFDKAIGGVLKKFPRELWIFALSKDLAYPLATPGRWKELAGWCAELEPAEVSTKDMPDGLARESCSLMMQRYPEKMPQIVTDGHKFPKLSRDLIEGMVQFQAERDCDKMHERMDIFFSAATRLYQGEEIRKYRDVAADLLVLAVQERREMETLELPQSFGGSPGHLSKTSYSA